MPESHASIIVVSEPSVIATAIKAEIRDAIREILPDLVRTATRKPWLTPAEAEELTGIKPRALAHLRATRQVVFSQRGRKILYATDSLERLIAAGRIEMRTH
jgi:hypothetical protein